MEMVLRLHVGGSTLLNGIVLTKLNHRAAIGIATFVPLWALSSRETLLDRHGKIDWIGSALGTSSLILFNFVWK